MAFFFSGLPVIMRKGGSSLENIGYLGLMGIPYALKFLWAPYIDRGAGNPNHYKRIVFVMTICYSLVAAFASRMDPQQNLLGLVGVLSLGLFFLATQDIAVDAIATRILKPEERGMGNGIQAAGAFAGYFVGGGFMLIFFDRIGGWSNAILILSGMLLLSLIPLFFFKEPAGPTKSRANLFDVFTFFRRKSILASLAIAVFSGVPLEAAYHKMRPLLVDAGFSTEKIGWYISIIGMASGLLVSILFGAVMKRIGVRKGFLLSLAFTVLAFPALLLPAFGYTEAPYVLAAVILGGACSGAMHATVYAVYMNNGREGKEGTDFTVQNALAFLAARIPAPLFGLFADKTGYSGLFMAAGALHIVILILAFVIIRDKKSPKQNVQLLEKEIGELAESEKMAL